MPTFNKNKVLIILLEYNDLFIQSGNLKQTIGEAILPLSFYIAVFNIAIVTIQAYFAQICSYYTSILLFASAFL